jgi:hypothetical protein
MARLAAEHLQVLFWPDNKCDRAGGAPQLVRKVRESSGVLIPGVLFVHLGQVFGGLLV